MGCKLSSQAQDGLSQEDHDGRLPSTVCDLALDSKRRRDFLDFVEQPQMYGVHIPEGEPQSMPAWAQLGLDETPLQYAPKLRGRYAAGEKQVRYYSSADNRQATATPVVNREGTVNVLQVLHRGKISRCHGRRDLPHGLPAYMHEDHTEKKCQTGDTFKRLMIKLDTEDGLASHKRRRSVQKRSTLKWRRTDATMASRRITRVSSSWTGSEATSTMTS